MCRHREAANPTLSLSSPQKDSTMNMQPKIALTPKLNPTHDFTDENGAYQIARKIREFWALRGLHPKIWVQKILTNHSAKDLGRIMFIVRSDMVGGRPQ